MDLGDPVDYVRRPVGIATDGTIYAIYVQGDSMDPEYKHGQLVYVRPKEPRRINTPVIVQIRNHNQAAVQAFIKILTRRTDEKIFLQQHNPTAVIEWDRRRVLAIHEVMDYNEVLGV